jgi:hypothetical protein
MAASVVAVERERSALAPKSPWKRMPKMAVPTAGKPAAKSVNQSLVFSTQSGSRSSPTMTMTDDTRVATNRPMPIRASLLSSASIWRALRSL